MIARPVWLSVAFGTVAAASPAQGAAAPIVVRVPAATPPSVAALLAAWHGDAVVVTATAALRDVELAEPAVLLLWDEWTLARAAAAAAPPELPFVDEVVLVVAPGVLTGADRTATWEQVALLPTLTDRLGIVAPDVDGAPWLAAMQDRLLRGDDEQAGIGIWTTLDARAGRLAGAYSQLQDELAGGRLSAAIGSRRQLARTVARSAAGLGIEPLPGGSVRLGIACTAAADERVRAVAAAWRTPERLRALAEAAGVDRGAAAPPALAPDVARRWWQRFELQVRGRGRGAEQLADWLDVVFGIGFLLCAWLLWRSLRDSPAMGSDAR